MRPILAALFVFLPWSFLGAQQNTEGAGVSAAATGGARPPRAATGGDADPLEAHLR
jgi:hypothetical protein